MDYPRPPGMAASTPRRTFTEPPRRLQGTSSSNTYDIDTLYSHPSVKIVSFTAGPRNIPLSPGKDIDPPAEPEPGTLEAHLTASRHAGTFIPIERGTMLTEDALTNLPARSAGTRNPGYFPLTPQRVTYFEWLMTVAESGFTRGMPPLPDRDHVVK